MKKIFQTLLLSGSALAFVVAPATNVFAQDAAAQQCTSPEKTALYEEQFLKNYKGTDEQRATAYTAAKDYVQKYGSCAGSGDADITKYLQNWIPKYEAILKAKEGEAAAKEVNDAIVTKDTGKLFTAGKNYLAKNPDEVGVMLYMADSGFAQANKKVDTYNTDTVAYAKQAIQKIEGGKTPTSGKWDPFKDKDEALAWMNYTIGYINGFRQQNMREAAPYFYKAAQYNSSIKTSHVPYAAIGQMYLDDYTKQAADYKTKYEAAPDTPEAKTALGMIKATADRAMDAFARAYSYAKANNKLPADVSKDLYETLTQFYKYRHNDQTTGMDAYVASVANSPLPDPTSTITPVVETTPAATTSGAVSTNGTGVGAANGTGTGAANGSGAGRANGNGVGVANNAGSGNRTTTVNNNSATNSNSNTAKPSSNNNSVRKPNNK